MPSVKFFLKFFKSRELFAKMNVTINKPGQFIIAPGGLTKLHANFGRKGNDYEKSNIAYAGGSDEPVGFRRCVCRRPRSAKT